ncbi:GNAT family N-acetyltransferase [Staphylococcus shinii]|uniref:GNAT family N-acetyltransferase n=1 Tax=Staphylococcus shinii TaxID=2912228 RepID=UPI000C34877C|nr:GNAT family N-acetyltransferase [Staphylococcus shinii]PKI09534.1 GNAT family N-acetyltransferase [Staphylococcus shinii]
MIKQLKSPSSEELDIISNIWLDSNLEVHHFINRDYWINNLDKVKKMLPDSTIYVYYVENEIIGFVGLYKNDIAGIFIKDSYRNKGIGKLFLENLKNDYNTLKLYVYEKNVRAARFYLKHNFEIKSKNLEEETQEYEYFMEWKRRR